MDEEQLELIPEPETPEPEPEPEQEQETQMADPTVKTGSMGDSADEVRTKTADEPKVHVVGRIEAFRITNTNKGGLDDEQRRLLEEQERR